MMQFNCLLGITSLLLAMFCIWFFFMKLMSAGGLLLVNVFLSCWDSFLNDRLVIDSFAAGLFVLFAAWLQWMLSYIPGVLCWFCK